MTKYCSLTFAKSELDTSTTSKTLDDAQILAYVENASQRIDGILQPTAKLKKRPFFAPYMESRSVVIQSHNVNTGQGTLDLHMFLLSLTSILAGAENVTSKVIAYPAGFAPFTKLQITTTDYSWYSLEQSPTVIRQKPNPLTITGIWGWNDDWANAWATGSSLSGNITATQASVNVVTSSPYAVGNLIMVDSEYMEITAIVGNALTVIRGVNGSTKATHSTGAVAYIYQIPEDIQRITARHANALYARRGSFEAQQLTQVGVVQYPQDLLMEMENTLNAYRM